MYEAAFSNVLTATGAVHAAPATVWGVIVNSHTSGTLKLWNNASAGSGTVLLDTFTFPAGSGIYTFPKAIVASLGVYATVGGTLNAQLVSRAH